MALDLLAIIKALWGFATFILLGILKITYSDFKKMQERQDDLEKDIIRLRSDMVTKDSLDDILDKKMKHLRDDIQGMRKEMTEMRNESRSEVSGLRKDIQSLLKTMLEQRDK